MSVIAVLPARGGSKRIPRKNIKAFLGRPMICYPIEVLQASGLFDRIIVSTDDQEIAEIAQQAGAEVPFLRPPELADDHVGTGGVVRHAIEWLQQNGETPTYVCCVYPTAPFLSSVYLQQGMNAVKAGWRLAISVTSFRFPIQRAVKLREEGGLVPFFPEYMPCRSQDLEPAYHDAGQFYWGDAQAWLDKLSVFSAVSAPIVLPRYLVQDIDDEEDWQCAELVYRALYQSVAGE